MSKTVTKADLVENLATQLGFNKTEAREFVANFFDEISRTLEQGRNVKLSGFGNFFLREKRERPGRNPKTGEPVTIAPRRVVVFKAGHKLKDLVAAAAEGGEDDAPLSADTG